MAEGQPVEHYVTLFDGNFLPMGLALHDSLSRHAGPFHLWVLCMDEAVAEQLARLAPPNLTALAPAAFETEELRAVKPSRSRAEWCWTVTPFAAQTVFDRCPDAARATYLDADLFFFADPAPLFAELERSGKHVLTTEHAYDPRYDQAAVSGRFCVQFLTFRNTPPGREVMRWWQERCLEWCYDRVEPDRFGDQKYLDRWPQLFEREVHVLSRIESALAPWNLRYLAQRHGGTAGCVFYHFHALRIIGPHRVRLSSYYDLGPAAPPLYDTYLASLRAQLARMHAAAMPTPVLPGKPQRWRSRLRERLRGTTHFATL